VDPAAVAIRLDRKSPVPLYFQVAQHLEKMIESGALPMGARLENEKELAGRFGLSVQTLRRAIQYLVDRGLLVRRRGVGTQVVQSKVTRQVELTSLHDELASAGRRPATKVISFAVQPASGVLAAKLGIPEGTQIYVFERLRYADDEPLALMRNHVPADLLPLSAADLEIHGLYDLLRAHDILPQIARQAIRVRAATAAEASALDEPTGAALLTMERSAYDDAGRAVEHGSHAYRASRYGFDLTLTGL
jgi:DNA-binding GntR family transcriptional regulator